jgi:hypothetical protein
MVHQRTKDTDGENGSLRNEKRRSLQELGFVPGDYLCVQVLLPKT